MGIKKGAKAPWILKFLAKKGWFLSFEWEKSNVTIFGPTRKSLEKSSRGPLGKNPSDAHDDSKDAPIHKSTDFQLIGRLFFNVRMYSDVLI